MVPFLVNWKLSLYQPILRLKHQAQAEDSAPKGEVAKAKEAEAGFVRFNQLNLGSSYIPEPTATRWCLWLLFDPFVISHIQNLSKKLWELRASQGKSLKARFGSNSRPRVQRRYHRKTSRMRSRWLMASDGRGIRWIHSETSSRNQGCSDWLWYFYLNV